MRTPIKLAILAVLLGSLAVRLALVSRGGQFFFPDENRYLASRHAAQHLLAGNITGALKAIGGIDHTGFKLLGIIPGLFEAVRGENPRVPACFFSLFSAANIALIFLLARKLGATEHEALWAMLLGATSNTLFYYSAHLLPYDPAMTMGLLALYAAVGRPASLGAAFLTGLLAMLTFFIYNGYYTLAGYAMAVHAALNLERWRRYLWRVALLGMGFSLPLFAFALVLYVFFGQDVLARYVAFAQTPTHGDFSEGVVLPFKYFWVSEGGMSIAWLLLLLLLLPAWWRKRWPGRLIISWVGVGIIYGWMAWNSAAMEKMVVYGRLVRQLVPFIAMAGGCSLAILERRPYGSFSTGLVAVGLLILAAVNMHKPLTLIFPREFMEHAKACCPGLQWSDTQFSFLAPDVVDAGSYRAHFIKYIYPRPVAAAVPEGILRLHAAHPQTYPPFLYEGFDREQREAFRQTDLVMGIEESPEEDPHAEAR